MFRSFIRSTVALTWPVSNCVLLVIAVVPVVLSVTDVVLVPPVGATTRGVALNCAYAAASNTFFASLPNDLLISVTGRRQVVQLRAVRIALPYSVTVMVPWLLILELGLRDRGTLSQCALRQRQKMSQ